MALFVSLEIGLCEYDHISVIEGAKKEVTRTLAASSVHIF